MFHLILADSELETVPREISRHKVIQWHARRRARRTTELILHSSRHYPAMRRLSEGKRRGRPDIVHTCALLALDTPLNHEKLLRFYIHTRHDKLITVDPVARLPRAQYRFIGLLEHLFLTGTAPPQNPLLRLEEASLTDVLKHIGPKKTITFSEHGEIKPPKEIYRGLTKEDEVCAVIGGFPHGDFISDVEELSDELVRMDPEVLRAPTVVARAIYMYELALGIQKSRLERQTNDTE
ncbi:MAG: 16S rRNA methyltransferase [Candidatus Hadarchaeota archaeon]|nr:16S rRNA methyltransferase [Candidatus Hadarchaeota archaeon]